MLPVLVAPLDLVIVDPPTGSAKAYKLTLIGKILFNSKIVFYLRRVLRFPFLRRFVCFLPPLIDVFAHAAISFAILGPL